MRLVAKTIKAQQGLKWPGETNKATEAYVDRPDGVLSPSSHHVQSLQHLPAQG
jgi:hypothetical protein